MSEVIMRLIKMSVSEVERPKNNSSGGGVGTGSVELVADLLLRFIHRDSQMTAVSFAVNKSVKLKICLFVCV